MAEETQPLPGSHRDAPQGMRCTGRVPSDEPITVSVYLKRMPAAPDDTVDRATLGNLRSVAHAGDIAVFKTFAASSGLAVGTTHAGRRLISLNGPAAAMETAFGTQLLSYEGDGRACRGRIGSLHVPDRITAVIGRGSTHFRIRDTARPH